MSDPRDKTSRREFLARSVKVAATVAAAGGLSGWLVNRSLEVAPSELVTLGDYRAAQTAGRMAVVEGTDRATMLRQGIDGIGGLSKFVKMGERVLIKVNAAFATPASMGATTHPEVAAELVRLCLQAGAKEVIVTDNPINDPANCFALTGIGKAVTAVGGRVMLPKDHYFRPFSVEGGRLIQDWPLLYEPLENVDRVIGVAPVKDHERAGASLSMKNWYGLLGGRRNQFHKDMYDTIKELAMMVQPTMVVLDGVQTMVSNGPTGGAATDLIRTQRMIVSTDQVAADSYAATELLDRRLDDIPYIAKAAEAGCGTMDYQQCIKRAEQL
jgi:uncharacterized protein (DUF362 family)